MVEKRKKQKIALSVLIAIFALGMSLGNSNYQFQIERINEGTWLEIPVQFTPAAQTAQFIDATQTTTYGTITNGPPDGMGNSDLGPTDDTELLEESYIDTFYEELVDEDFSGDSLPPGWSDGGDWIYSGGLAIADTVTDRELSHFALDLTGYGLVNISFQAGSYHPSYYLEDTDWALHRYNGTNLLVMYITGCGSDTTLRNFEFSMNSNEYNGFRYFFADITAVPLERIKIDNVLVEAETTGTFYRFEAVFRFDSVSYSYSNYFLFVDFYTALTGSDDLDMYIETGDPTPDSVGGFKCAENVQNDFSVNVTSYITGDTVYLSIYDDYRNGDESQTTAYIQKIYLYNFEWENIVIAEYYFPVGWHPIATFGFDLFFIFLGLIMIPTSTVYLARGGREEMNTEKLFYGLIIFFIGWGLIIGGIMP